MLPKNLQFGASPAVHPEANGSLWPRRGSGPGERRLTSTPRDHYPARQALGNVFTPAPRKRRRFFSVAPAAEPAPCFPAPSDRGVREAALPLGPARFRASLRTSLRDIHRCSGRDLPSQTGQDSYAAKQYTAIHLGGAQLATTERSDGSSVHTGRFLSRRVYLGY